MSVGNLKDYGNKGNNFPFQLKVLKGLADTVATLVNGIIVTISNVVTVTINPESKVTTVTRPTTAGAIADGANSVSIANVGTGNGTVKATILKPGETVSFDAGAVNNTLDAIDYDATGTEFLIITVV